MRACVQRVSRAQVTVAGEVVGRIGPGLLVLLGVAAGDGEDDARQLAEKIVSLRVFDDEAGKMNRSLADVGGGLLVVSQFTLLGDCRKGRRPSFDAAAPPDLARSLYERFADCVRERGIEVATGRFREMMQVELVNDGPVTLLLDSRKAF
jgi:D-tyrosyl-tRNA(Tyr) deacylase